MATQFFKFIKYLSRNHTRIKKQIDTICKNKKIYGFNNFTKKQLQKIKIQQIGKVY